MVCYIFAMVSFAIAMFGRVSDRQFACLLLFAGFCLYLGADQVRSVLNSPKSERKS